ncbi:hypothetical protein [Cryptosporangium arvum]|uniref:hypothetical protein n=1 Tax=Cryptosporangium arvum TaxID=80871 RepID=UPI0012EDF384|nr:hypothetical protein [Cryptosporangium arvum]
MQPEDPVPGWSTPPLPNQSVAWRPPQPQADDTPPAPLLDLRPAAPPEPPLTALPEPALTAPPPQGGARPPEPPRPAPPLPALPPQAGGLPPVPHFLAQTGSAPAPARGRTRIAVLVGVIAAVLVVVAGVTTTLALRPNTDPELLRAESSPVASDPPQLGAESNAGPEAGSAPSGPQRDSDKATTGSPTTDPGEGATTSEAPVEPAPRTEGTDPTEPQQPTEAPQATEAPKTQAPTTKAPATKAPATKAPATKAPATKPPATKAPAKKAPEIDKAVAKSGKRGAGPCSAKLVGGYGCYQTYGDLWWVYDTKGDSHSAVVFWELGNRSGQCANSMGNGKIGACNKNYAEGSTGRAKVCIMDWDTKQMHGCTAYFTFKTS